jgi:hypothetical protein
MLKNTMDCEPSYETLLHYCLYYQKLHFEKEELFELAVHN